MKKCYRVRVNPCPSVRLTVCKDGKKESLKFRSCLDSNGLLKVLNVDQFSGKRFMLNENGFPMNDIEAFETCQSDSVAEAVLRRIQEIKSSNMDQNLTPQEMFDSIVPSNWSSPAEYIRASKVFASKLYAQNQRKMEAARAAAAASAKASAAKENKVSAIVEPE